MLSTVYDSGPFLQSHDSGIVNISATSSMLNVPIYSFNSAANGYTAKCSI